MGVVGIVIQNHKALTGLLDAAGQKVWHLDVLLWITTLGERGTTDVHIVVRTTTATAFVLKHTLFKID